MANFITRTLRRMGVSEQPPVVAVLRLNGAIGATGGLRPGLTISALASSIGRLFADKTITAAALVINSPGGSPVQAALIHDRVRLLAREKGIRVMTFAEDVGASGGYMLMLAGDEVYAHENSIVGSIGVVSAGFGFTKLIDKIGVERRVHISGDRKAMLDPFRPEKEQDVEHLEALQKEVHESFKAMVRERRAGKIKGEESELFSGAFWTGAKAQDFGLIDGLGDLYSICRKKFGDKVEFRLVAPRRGWFGWGGLSNRSDGVPMAQGWAQDLLAAVEERSLWSRFGL
jgi:signal peptide peptidase SppA